MRAPIPWLLSSLSWVSVSLAGAALVPTLMVSTSQATPMDFPLRYISSTPERVATN